MDGPFYQDSRAPFITSDIAAVTIATTNKALYPVSNFPVLGGNYFGFIGKAIQIDMFGRITTGTLGNGQFAVYWGSGADANGTILAQSTAVAFANSVTNISWKASFVIRCRSIGASGTLFCTGWSLFGVTALLSTNAPLLVPSSAPVVSGAVDLTASNIVSVQFNASTATSTSMQLHELCVAALN
jgi:hypothetical protein